MIGALDDPYTDVALGDDAAARADLGDALQDDDDARERVLAKARRAFDAATGEPSDADRLAAWVMVAARVAGIPHDWDMVRTWLARLDDVPGSTPAQRVGVDPWIFRNATADDTSWEGGPAFLVVTNEPEQAAQALRRAMGPLYTTGDDGYPARPEVTGRYTPNYVSEPEVTNAGVEMYADTKGVLPRPMGEAMVEIVREALAADAVTAWITWPNDPSTPLATKFIAEPPPGEVTRTGWLVPEPGEGPENWAWVRAGREVEAVTAGRLHEQVIAVSSHGTDLWVWDVRTGELVREIATEHMHKNIGKPALVEHGGTTLAACGCTDDTASVWDLGTGEQVGPRLRGHDGPVRTCDGVVLDHRPVLVTGSTGEAPVRVWDVRSGSVIATPDHPEGDVVRAVVITQVDGDWVGVTVDARGVVRSFDLRTGESLHAPHRPAGATIRTLALDPGHVEPTVKGIGDEGSMIAWKVGTPPPGPASDPRDGGYPGLLRLETTTWQGQTCRVVLSAEHSFVREPTDHPEVTVWEAPTSREPLRAYFPGASDIAVCTVDGELVVLVASNHGRPGPDGWARISRWRVAS